MNERVDVAIDIYERLERLEASNARLESLVNKMARKAGVIPPEAEFQVSTPVKQVPYGDRCDELKRLLREKLAQGYDLGRAWDLVDDTMQRTAGEEFSRNHAQRKGSVVGFRQFIEDGLTEEAAGATRAA